MSLVQWLVLPLFLHVALILLVGLRNLHGRYTAVRSGKTKLSDIALDSSKWPDELRKLGNNYANQFEAPMLWYGVCALLVSTGLVDAVQAVLSWAFIAARFSHSFVHTGSNNIPRRMFAFLASFAVLLAMWTWFGIRLFVVG